MSRGASDPSQASVIKKSLRSLRPLRAEENVRVVAIYLTQRTQRTQSFNSLLFALALEMSQVSLRQESAEAATAQAITFLDVFALFA